MFSRLLKPISCLTAIIDSNHRAASSLSHKLALNSNIISSNGNVLSTPPIITKMLPQTSSMAMPRWHSLSTHTPQSTTRRAFSKHINSNQLLSTTCTLQVLKEQRRFYQAALKPRLICSGCYYIWRHGRKYVECSDHPRHKQMKRVARRKIWQEDYSKGRWVKALDFHKKYYREAERNTDHTSLSHAWLAGKIGTDL